MTKGNGEETVSVELNIHRPLERSRLWEDAIDGDDYQKMTARAPGPHPGDVIDLRGIHTVKTGYGFYPLITMARIFLYLVGG